MLSKVTTFFKGKIMNKKVFISMLVLSIVFLVGMYVIKIFFPEEFVLAIENERIITIGTFINSHKILFYICGGITSFITYWLYCCACKHTLRLRWYENLLIIAVVVMCRLLSIYDANMCTIISWTSFAFLPALMGGDLKTCAIIFTTHSIAQGLSLRIRNLTMYLASGNFLTLLLLAIDMYLWLILFYVIFNYKKENKNGN